MSRTKTIAAREPIKAADIVLVAHERPDGLGRGSRRKIKGCFEG